MHHFTKSSSNRFPQVGPFKYKKSAKSLKKTQNKKQNSGHHSTEPETRGQAVKAKNA